MICCPVQSISRVTYAHTTFEDLDLQSLKVLHPMFMENMHLQENTLFDLRNVAQYPLHHDTYAAAMFEVASSNGLGGDAVTRKYIS